MAHLHKSGLVHSDIKACNVLLRSSDPLETDRRGFLAKISDFGLSLSLDNGKTHVEDLYQGTTTHMAPEILLRGRQSKASDVYAFGIVMWELYTGGTPFAHVPVSTLGFQVIKNDLRPVSLPLAPHAYVNLTQRCWSALPESRPSFEEILSAIGLMIADHPCTQPCSRPGPPVQMKTMVTLDRLKEDFPGSSMGVNNTYDARQAIQLRPVPSTTSPDTAFVCAPVEDDSEYSYRSKLQVHDERIDIAVGGGRRGTSDYIKDAGIVWMDAGGSTTIVGRLEL